MSVVFINPPPFGVTGDFSQNPIYPYGSTLNIEWTPVPGGNATSLTLWQLEGPNATYLFPFEYLTGASAQDQFQQSRLTFS